MNAFDVIRDYYGDRTTGRSGVLLINHIREGCDVLRALGVSQSTIDAYCLHPMFQSDADLMKNAQLFEKMDPFVAALVMEYRSVANEYLSTRRITQLSEIRFSPLSEVTAMLRADKLQNCKDFLQYHLATHERAPALFEYFRNWHYVLGMRSVFEALVKNPASLHLDLVKELHP